MSVGLLSGRQDVRVPDELESFLLVLIYYAVRYLNSSIRSGHAVATFLDECFDCYTVNTSKKEIHCGERKYAVIKEHGQLLHYCPDQRGRAQILFSSPMDRLLSELLQSFYCYYSVVHYDQWRRENPLLARLMDSEQSPAPSLGISSPPTSSSNLRLPLLPQSPVSHSSNDYGAETHPLIVPAPTEAQKQASRRVATHSWMLAALLAASKSRAWAEEDRHVTGDRVPKNWRSTHDPIPSFREVEG